MLYREDDPGRNICFSFVDRTGTDLDIDWTE
jgi:hypothetical protein